MHPLDSFSFPQPDGVCVRPHGARRLAVPGSVPEQHIWVRPEFFAYAQATPDWHARAVREHTQDVAVILSRLAKADLLPGEGGPGLTDLHPAAATEVSHD